MKRNTSISLGALFIYAWSSAAHGLLYNESASGDLSYLYPGDTTNVLTLGAGQNTVSGRLSSPYDYDTFAFSIPQSTQLDGISISFSQSTASGYFASNQSAGYGLSSGIGLPYAPYPTGNYAQEVYFSTDAGSIPLFSLITPLGAGTYTVGDFFHSDFSSGYVDYTYSLNVQSLAPPPITHTPTNYGLFIGAKNGSILFDQNAQTMADAFVSGGKKNGVSTITTVITGDLTVNADGNPTSSITINEISVALAEIRAKMQPDDTFTLYINDHGGSITKDPSTGKLTLHSDGIGDEIIQIGDYLVDNALASLLKQFDGFRKVVFLDSCHSGGFWGGTDTTEYGPLGHGFKDLNQLGNIAFYAAADEAYPEYILGDGLSFWGEALESALEDPTWLGVPLTGGTLGNYLYLKTLSNAYWNPLTMPTPVWHELDFGDPVLADMSLIHPFSATSADFDLSIPLFSSVPEPGTLTLIGLGIAGLAWRRRRI